MIRRLMLLRKAIPVSVYRKQGYRSKIEAFGAHDEQL